MFDNFSPENLAFCEIMWENVVESGRPRVTIWRMRNPCRYLRLQTPTMYKTAFPLLRWLHERASLLRYTYIVCLVIYYLYELQIEVFVYLRLATTSSFRTRFSS